MNPINSKAKFKLLKSNRTLCTDNIITDNDTYTGAAIVNQTIDIYGLKYIYSNYFVWLKVSSSI